MEDLLRESVAENVRPEAIAVEAGPVAGEGRERRRHPRYECEGRAEVFLPHGGLLIRGRILDLSVAGCFIEAASINLERGTHVEVYFETKQLKFRVGGSIAVLYPKSGVGITFLNLSQRVSRQIESLVKELAETA